MRSNLPLEVLGLIGPVLGWVEGAEGLRFPEAWIARRLSTRRREEAWLVRELPTYSEDSVEEVVRSARTWSRGRAARQPAASATEPRLPKLLRGSRQSQVAPPAGYRLADVFGRLAERYFEWRGTELTIRSGRMEELHELALRFPVGHLVRHVHARGVALGFVPEMRAAELPEQLALLHTSSHGLRTVVRRGLTEGHLHLWGVLTGGETWADHLLKPLPPGILRRYRREEERLFVLARAAVRILAFAALQVRLCPQARADFRLVSLLDALYNATGELEERAIREGLRDELRKVSLPPAVHEREPDRHPGTTPGGEVLLRALGSRDPEVRDLLRLAHPMIDRLRRQRERSGRRRHTGREGIRERLRLIDRLHLTVHRLLIEDPGDGERARREHEANSRELLHQVFFRYLVYQTHHWQLGTQSGRTTGLRYFKRYMHALQRATLDPDEVETQGLIVERLRNAGDVRTVEGRISPPAVTDELVPWILGYGEGVKRGELDGFGLVVHFIKADVDEVEDRRLPDTRRRLLHGRVRRRTRQQAKRLFYLLSRSHPAVPFVVGIDAANLELTTPPEVFAPAFRFLRDYPVEPRPPSSPWERFGAHAEVASLLRDRRLGLTYHVGEDFRHLLSGLRAIDEVVQFLRPRPGDRLGHAIALALDPEVWMRQNGFQAVVPKIEALDTLVWLLHFLGPGNDTLGELGVEAWIQQLAREIYGAAALPDEPWLRDLAQRVETLEMEIEGLPPVCEREEEPPPGRTSRTFLPPRLQWNWSPLTLHHAWRLRQLDPYLLDLESALHGRPRLRDAPANSRIERRWIHVQRQVLAALDDHGAASRSAFHLLSLHWYHDEVRANGEQLYNLDMQPDRHKWIRLCREVQAKMKRSIDRRQLIVEVNPSSNRLVGPMESFGEHHVFQMSLDESGELDRSMRVTVNTDDPGVFNTSLPHEYYLLGEILLDRGMPEPKVEAWLEWLRTNGEDASFTRALPRAADPRVRQILHSLERAKEPIGERMSGDDVLRGFWNRLRRGHRELERRELGSRLRRLEEAHLRWLGGDPDLGPRPG